MPAGFVFSPRLKKFPHLDLTTVKEILRHKSISMTLRYSHLSADHKKSAVEALSKPLTVEAEKADKTA